MEQRKKLPLAERKTWQAPVKRPRQGYQDIQEKPSVGKKGARGQSAGMASKAANKGTVGKKAAQKKSGRAKQESGKEKQAAQHKHPRRTE
jgi:hypothetical protein